MYQNEIMIWVVIFVAFLVVFNAAGFLLRMFEWQNKRLLKLEAQQFLLGASFRVDESHCEDEQGRVCFYFTELGMVWKKRRS